jgi:hypothetical protein
MVQETAAQGQLNGVPTPAVQDRMRLLYLRLRRQSPATRRGHVNVRDIVQLARLAREWKVDEEAIVEAVARVGTEINEVHLSVERNRKRSLG